MSSQRVTVTLQSVADESGVSRSTASRALNGSPTVNTETRERVERASVELGYRPNKMARGLRTQSSHLVGLVLTNLVNASFHVMAEVVQQRLDQLGYQTILCVTQGQEDQEKRYVEMLLDHQAEGLIMIGSNGVVRGPDVLREPSVPVVNLIRRQETPVGDTILVADSEGAYEATRHLIQLGHRRIGLIVGEKDNPAGNERTRGYISALVEADIPVDPELMRSGPYAPETGSKAAVQLLDLPDPPTAWFIANHEAAFGALPVLVARDVSVPTELSVVCFEDAPWFSYWRPPLTVVDHGPKALGELAADLLLRRLARSDPGAEDPREVHLGARLVIRSSTSAPHA